MEDYKKAAQDEDFLVTARDCLRAGICGSAQRQFAQGHDVDFRDFLRNGCSARFLLSMEDAQVDRTVKAAWERIHGK